MNEPQISVFLDDDETGDRYVGLMLVNSSLFEDDGELHPVAGLSPAQARKLAAALIVAACTIEEGEG